MAVPVGGDDRRRAVERALPRLERLAGDRVDQVDVEPLEAGIAAHRDRTFDVVGRGAPVTIDVAPDAEVHPGALTLLEKLLRLPDDVAGPAGAGAVPRPRSGSGGAGPTRRPPGPRLPMARRAPT